MTKQVEVVFLGRDRVQATFKFLGSSELSPLASVDFSGSGCGPFLEALSEFKKNIFELPEKNRVIQGDAAFDLLVPDRE